MNIRALDFEFVSDFVLRISRLLLGCGREPALRDLIETSFAKEESLVAKTVMSGAFPPAKRSLIGHSAGHPTVTQVYRKGKPGRLQFALTFANQGARLRFALVAPTGQKFEKEVESTLVVEVPDAPPGPWQYTVTARMLFVFPDPIGYK